ncbi:MAG: glycosyltransferase family 2 protein [Caulobacteraceae bacterium]|nr:glycosyltransferase family 2 protein [Caulobacteraceae bacterium]
MTSEEAPAGIGTLICHRGGQVAPGPSLMVVWVGDRPVGQLRVERLEPSPAPTMGDLSVTVVVCTRDRPQELARCLSSFAEQTLRPGQVIVVDNASLGDETRQVSRKAGVTYLREDRPGLDIARNTGARAASGDVVAYADDDVVLHPDWLKRLIQAFDEARIWAVTGLVLPAELATEAQWIFETHWGFGKGFQRRDFGPEFFAADRRHGCPAWEIGAGASMAFRRSVFERVGYFDERLDVGAAGCSGDSEFWHRILTAGGWCRYEPASVAYHYHRRDMDGLRRQIRAYMRGHAAALLVQYERSRNLGNLRRLFLTLPHYYARRAVGRIVRGVRSDNRLLGAEVAGLASGVAFYLRTPASAAGAGR